MDRVTKSKTVEILNVVKVKQKLLIYMILMQVVDYHSVLDCSGIVAEFLV